MSALELKPCPFCGFDDCKIQSNGDYHWVVCPADDFSDDEDFAERGCGVEGSVGSSHELAITAWNRRADLAPTLPSADYVAVPKAGQNLMEVALWTELREAMIKDRPDQIKPPMSLGPNATAVIKRTIADYLDAIAARPDQPATEPPTLIDAEHSRMMRAARPDQPAADTRVPAPSDKIAEAARAAHEALWELHPDNYDHDDVLKLNDASVEAIFLLADAIGETHGKTPEWWEARRRALAGKGE